MYVIHIVKTMLLVLMFILALLALIMCMYAYYRKPVPGDYADDEEQEAGKND